MAIPSVEFQADSQADNHPLLMDHSEIVGCHGHAVYIPRDNVASSSASHRNNHDDLDELQYGRGPSIGVPALSQSTSGDFTTAPNSQNASFSRRGDGRSHRHRSPLNSGLWISIELVVNVSQIIAAISVLSVSRNEHPRAPLFVWAIGYTIGCIATLPHLYWRYIHRNHQSSVQESVSWNSSENETLEANSYRAISSACASEVEEASNTNEIPTNNFVTASPSLCLVFLTFSCIGYAMPFILCAMICCCLPCIISVMGIHECLDYNRGATGEAINALVRYKFKRNRVHSSEGGEDGSGVLAARTDKVCCICLSKFADNDDLRELPCMHFFHMECVDKWLKINALCPLCKAEVGNSTTTTMNAPAIGFGRRHNDNRVGDDVESQQ